MAFFKQFVLIHNVHFATSVYVQESHWNGDKNVLKRDNSTALTEICTWSLLMVRTDQIRKRCL